MTMATRPGKIDLRELESLVKKGEIDTIVLAFTDMQGRLIGKRVSANFFVDEIAAHGAECCNYLLAVDVEMNTVGGYRISSWERGYGDMAMIPDLRRRRAEMQIIFQDPFASLNPRMRVYEILEEGLAALQPDLDAKQRRASSCTTSGW